MLLKEDLIIVASKQNFGDWWWTGLYVKLWLFYFPWNVIWILSLISQPYECVPSRSQRRWVDWKLIQMAYSRKNPHSPDQWQTWKFSWGWGRVGRGPLKSWWDGGLNLKHFCLGSFSTIITGTSNFWHHIEELYTFENKK